VEVLKKAALAADEVLAVALEVKNKAIEAEAAAEIKAGKEVTEYGDAKKQADVASKRVAEAAEELHKAQLAHAAVPSPWAKRAVECAMTKCDEAKMFEALANRVLVTAQANKNKAEQDLVAKHNARAAAVKAVEAAQAALYYAKGKLEGAIDVTTAIAAIPTTVQVTVGMTSTPAPTAWNLKLAADGKTLIATHPDGDSFIYDVTNKRDTKKEK
jgi:hypothetical protein